MQFNYSPAVQCVGGCNSNIRNTEQSCSKKTHTHTPLFIYIATLNELVINFLFFFLSAFAKLQKNDYQLRHVCPSVSVSVWNVLVRSGRIFMNFIILIH